MAISAMRTRSPSMNARKEPLGPMSSGGLVSLVPGAGSLAGLETITWRMDTNIADESARNVKMDVGRLADLPHASIGRANAVPNKVISPC